MCAARTRGRPLRGKALQARGSYEVHLDAIDPPLDARFTRAAPTAG